MSSTRWVSANPPFLEVLKGAAPDFYTLQKSEEKDDYIRNTVVPALNDCARPMQFDPEEHDDCQVRSPWRQVILAHPSSRKS